MKARRAVLAACSALVVGSAALDKVVHEKGRCAMRGSCGKESFFYPNELPCPDNGRADDPDKGFRKKLVEVCGDAWSKGPVCCTEEQIDTLKSNLAKSDGLIGSCPACKANFANLFCTFTCSPDQSLFVNVTETIETSGKKEGIVEVDTLFDPEYGRAFFDSCKEVKVGQTGSKAISFLGNPSNYSGFLDFLGRKDPFFGSPFQINFLNPKGREKDGMKAAAPESKRCDDPDEKYRCACVDCPGSCPKLPEVKEAEYCYVGALPCLSFAAITLYCGFLLLLATAVVGRIAYQRHEQRRNERLRLLQDSAASDDEEETEIVPNGGVIEQRKRVNRLNSWCDRAFARLGGLCARYPFFTIGTSFAVVVLFSLGWINFEVERDPVRLWVSPRSAAAREKEFFDKSFGPFYRTQQMFLVNDDPEAPTILTHDNVWWQLHVEEVVREYKHNNLTLDDLCYKPTGEGCVIQSISGYFEGSKRKLDKSNWQQILRECSANPAECRPKFGLPLEKELLFGGMTDPEDVFTSQALVVTWVLNNHPTGSEEEKRVIEWERGLAKVLDNYQKGLTKHKDVFSARMSFKTEISLEDELNQASNTDANIVAVSYLIMFIYASIALGSVTLSVRSIMENPTRALIQSKFTLGISGILIVLMSVSASVGLFSGLGIKVTLIIAEVIPFLVLAVGVDNIFLIVHEFERANQAFPDEEIDSRMARAMGRIGPSILLSATTETIAFVLGVFVGMPAVRNFAAYAAGAVFINAALQVTMFVAVLALDQRRVESSRMDCFPFIKVKSGVRSGDEPVEPEEGFLQAFIRKHYAPFLLRPRVKVGIYALFLGVLTAAVALIPTMELGLDQRIAIPTGSYLIDYFNDLYDYFGAGPPVYFVTTGVNATAKPEQLELCSRFSTCNTFSLPNVLELESRRPNVSYITGSTANWLDDYLYWLDPATECCKDKGKSCLKRGEWNNELADMPQGDRFIRYLDQWLDQVPDQECPRAGKAAYSSAVVVDHNKTMIPASHFRVSHTPLRSQSDFINALASARRIAASISEEQGISVFPYSSFYVFFDPYATIVKLAGALLGFAGALIFVATALLLGSLRAALTVTATVVMVVVDVLGTMAAAGVSLNPLSLVNLVICVGLAVEFCAHVARAFVFPERRLVEAAKARGLRGADARSWAALVNVGGSVFTGITVTKLLGVCVLAFTRSKIFEIYYFRVWLALVVWAALHALVFLPVALSLFGGQGYYDPEYDEYDEDLSSRRYRALIAEDEDSDDDY